MNPSKNPNAELLLSAVEKLVPLLDQIVFVGGCATGMLITDPGAAPVRPTVDVDAIVEIASYTELMALEDRLRQLGFEQPHVDGAPLCRWMHGDVILDLMPTDPKILGFSSRWYPQALASPETRSVGGHQIRLISAPHFLATKLEAFHGRGQFDYGRSRDVEDIVTVVDGRAEIIAEVEQAAPSLQQYLSAEFASLLTERDFLEALPGHLLPDAASQQRIRIVLTRMRQIAGRR
ncbi:MAG TPA: nucleotidyl transferase AbiEii/AbiGii toxin family protein [Terriglobales bacterium]|nr:nucleotidyl transferase AbiEii/AbiGii toxin family protein [Terriglobales bacterium]